MIRLNDGHGVIFSVTPAVEFTDVPSVSGGAVAQQPLRIVPDSRRKEHKEIAEVKLVVGNYRGNGQSFWKQKYIKEGLITLHTLRQYQVQGIYELK